MNWIKNSNINIQNFRNEDYKKKYLCDKIERQIIHKSVYLNDEPSDSQDLINLNMICKSSNNFTEAVKNEDDGLSLEYKQRTLMKRKRKIKEIETYEKSNIILKHKHFKIEKGPFLLDDYKCSQISSSISSSQNTIQNSNTSLNNNEKSLNFFDSPKREQPLIQTSSNKNYFSFEEMNSSYKSNTDNINSISNEIQYVDSFKTDNSKKLNEDNKKNFNLYYRMESKLISNSDSRLLKESLELYKIDDSNHNVDDFFCDNSNNENEYSDDNQQINFNTRPFFKNFQPTPFFNQSFQKGFYF